MQHALGQETRIGYWWEVRKKNDNQDDLDVGGRLVLNAAQNNSMGGKDWSNLDQDMNQWTILVNMLMNVGFGFSQQWL